MENPEAFLDLLTMRSQKERYHDNPAETTRSVVARDAQGLANQEDLELFVRDLTIDDSIADRFAESSGDTPTVMGVVCSPSNRQAPPNQPICVTPKSAKTDDVIASTQVPESLPQSKRPNFVSTLFHRKSHRHCKNSTPAIENVGSTSSKSNETNKAHDDDVGEITNTFRVNQGNGKVHKNFVQEQKAEFIEKSNQDFSTRTDKKCDNETILKVSNSSSKQTRAILESPCLKADEFYHERPGVKENMATNEHGVVENVAGSSGDKSGQNGSDRKGSRKNAKLKQDNKTTVKSSLFNLGRVFDQAFIHRKRKSGQPKECREIDTVSGPSYPAGQLEIKDSDNRKCSSNVHLENMATCNGSNSHSGSDMVKAEVHACAFSSKSRSSPTKSRPTSFDDATAIKDVPNLPVSIPALDDASFDQLYMQHAQCKLRRKNYSKSDSRLDTCGIFQKHAHFDAAEKKKREQARRSKNECRRCKERTSLNIRKHRESGEVGSSNTASSGNSIDSIVNSVGDLFREHALDKVMGSRAWYEVDSDVSICDVSYHGNQARMPTRGVSRDRAVLCDIIESSTNQQRASTSSCTLERNGKAKTNSLKDDNNNNHHPYHHNNNNDNACNRSKNSVTSSSTPSAIADGCPACNSCNLRANSLNIKPGPSILGIARPPARKTIGNSPDLSASFPNFDNMCHDSRSLSPLTTNSTELSTECDCNSLPCESECKHYQNCSSLSRAGEGISGNSGNCRNESNGFSRKCHCCCPWCCDWAGDRASDHSIVTPSQNDPHGRMSRESLLVSLSEALVKRLWSAEKKLDRARESLTYILTWLRNEQLKLRLLTTAACRSPADRNTGARASREVKDQRELSETVAILGEFLERTRDHLNQRFSESESEDLSCQEVLRCLLEGALQMSDRSADRLSHQLDSLIDASIRGSQNDPEASGHFELLRQNLNSTGSLLIGPELANHDDRLFVPHSPNGQSTNVIPLPSRPAASSNDKPGISTNHDISMKSPQMIGSPTANGHRPLSTQEFCNGDRCLAKISKSTNQKCSPVTSDQQYGDLHPVLKTMAGANSLKTKTRSSRSGNIDSQIVDKSKAKITTGLKNDLAYNLANGPHCPCIAHDSDTNFVQNSRTVCSNRSSNGDPTNNDYDYWYGRKKRRGYNDQRVHNEKPGSQYSISKTRESIPILGSRKLEEGFSSRNSIPVTLPGCHGDVGRHDSEDESVDDNSDDDDVDDHGVLNRRNFGESAVEGPTLLRRHLQSVQRLHHRNDDVIETVVTSNGDVLVPAMTHVTIQRK